MEYFEITGGARLSGEINVHGAKNSVLPILAGAVLIKGESIIHNCPDLTDVRVTLDILRRLGASVKKEKETLIINTENISCSDIPPDMMQEMRSSILFLGALASRCGAACLCLPGGCEIGLRPVDLHIKALESLGYDIAFDTSNICCKNNNAKAGRITLAFPSVGATENAILASVLLSGKTTIINAAAEPEIEDLADFLNSAGADIRGVSTPVIEINGADSLHGTNHSVIPDRIEAATFLSAAAMTKGDIKINKINLSHLSPNLPAFYDMGCKIDAGSGSLRIKAPKRLKSIKRIETGTFPGFPTDSQALLTANLSVAKGTSAIKENIFENRFRHIAQLQKFGADINCIDSRVAFINGVEKLHSAEAACTDLRGGAAVLLAALAAEGTSKITDIHHIFRGYEEIESSLNSLGADIKRKKDEEKGS